MDTAISFIDIFDFGEIHSAILEENTRDSLAKASPNLHVNPPPLNLDPTMLTTVPPSDTPWLGSLRITLGASKKGT